MEQEIFLHGQWASSFFGLNAWPENYDMFLDGFDFSELTEKFQEMLAAIKHTAEQMPSQQEYINSGLN